MLRRYLNRRKSRKLVIKVNNHKTIAREIESYYNRAKLSVAAI